MHTIYKLSVHKKIVHIISLHSIINIIINLMRARYAVIAIATVTKTNIIYCGEVGHGEVG